MIKVVYSLSIVRVNHFMLQKHKFNREKLLELPLLNIVDISFVFPCVLKGIVNFSMPMYFFVPQFLMKNEKTKKRM